MVFPALHGSENDVRQPQNRGDDPDIERGELIHAGPVEGAVRGDFKCGGTIIPSRRWPFCLAKIEAARAVRVRISIRRVVGSELTVGGHPTMPNELLYTTRFILVANMRRRRLGFQQYDQHILIFRHHQDFCVEFDLQSRRNGAER
jgi:hypothetical protein